MKHPRKILDFKTYDFGSRINEDIDPARQKRMLSDLKILCDETGADYQGICKQLGIKGYEGISSLSSENLEWLDKTIGAGEWEVNSETGKIDIKTSLRLGSYYNRASMDIEELPEGINFGVVGLNFEFYSNKALKSSRGFPTEVGGNLILNKVKFENLKGISSIKVKQSIKITECPDLTSLEGCPEEIMGNFDISDNMNLVSLKGGPKKIEGDFNCSGCNLTSLDGGPIEVMGRYLGYNNNLSTLNGFSKINGRWAPNFNSNNLYTLEGIDLNIIPIEENLKKNLYPGKILIEVARKARDYESWTAAYLWLLTTEKFQRMSKAQRDPIRSLLATDRIQYAAGELSKIWKEDVMKDPAVRRLLIRTGVMDRAGNLVDKDFKEIGDIASDLSDLGF